MDDALRFGSFILFKGRGREKWFASTFVPLKGYLPKVQTGTEEYMGGELQAMARSDLTILKAVRMKVVGAI